ncbi:hypothetical protein ABZ896_12455 [Streptomyces sp. NPDC047072]|uniref:hypothetical protein n=1 Tax=Streptomyces sp. NPDC047072 TaxID=3154809 RepID=UPI003403EDD5
MTRFEIDMSDESGSTVTQAAAASGVDPNTYVTSLVKEQLPRHLFLTGAQACIDEFGEALAERFGPSRPHHQAA